METRDFSHSSVSLKSKNDLRKQHTCTGLPQTSDSIVSCHLFADEDGGVTVSIAARIGALDFALAIHSN